MYKIVHRDGYEIEVGFEDLKDALKRLTQIKRLGAGKIYVVDNGTKVGRKVQRLKDIPKIGTNTNQ